MADAINATLHLLQLGGVYRRSQTDALAAPEAQGAACKRRCR